MNRIFTIGNLRFDRMVDDNGSLWEGDRMIAMGAGTEPRI
jgi:hypothetical protein